MRALTAKQAGACEAAKSRRCRCRCGGVFHGAGRSLADVPAGDPHAVDGQLELTANGRLGE